MEKETSVEVKDHEVDPPTEDTTEEKISWLDADRCHFVVEIKRNKIILRQIVQ